MEYIESSARSLGFRYHCDEPEYMELRRLAKKMRLSRRLIQDLDHHYKNVHAVDIPHLMRIGKMNAFIGMAHDACVKAYCNTAMLIEEAFDDPSKRRIVLWNASLFSNLWRTFVEASKQFARSALKKLS